MAEPSPPTPAPELDQLLPQVYDELRRLARAQRHRLAAGDTLNTTALVHETYLKLAAARFRGIDRGHFFAVAAKAMRQIVVDRARYHLRAKRGAGATELELLDIDLASDNEAERLLALDRALERLGDLDSRLVRIVESRYFAGLSPDETAEALDISERTERRLWAQARAWLYRELTETAPSH